MNRLAKTRSQHFVSSPRRVASPLKHRQSLNRAHTSKRRRLGLGGGGTSGLSRGVTAADAILVSPPSTDDEDDEIGDEEAIASASSSSTSAISDTSPTQSQSVRHAGAGRKGRGKGKGKPVAGGVGQVLDDVFGSEGSVSPRKRKRPGGGGMEASGSETGDSGSWIEVDEDEDEPEFIVESDQHLLVEAPAHALHRLRKAELVRLWKVAGMWNEEEHGDGLEEDESIGMSKKDLVDGLVAGRGPISHPVVRLVSPLPTPRSSPRRRSTLEGAFEMKRLRSSSSLALALHSPASSNSQQREGRPRARIDTDATPKAAPRTRARSKVRTKSMVDGTPMRTVPRRRAEGRSEKRRNGYRRRSLADGLGGERRARFGEEVKSPAHGLLRRRRSSTSSTYTTTDTSPPTEPSRITPRRLSRRTSSRTKVLEEVGKLSISTPNGSTGRRDQAEDAEEEDDSDPTPLVARLRPRTKSFQKHAPSEVEADDEDEGESGDDADASLVESPVPSRSLRSRDRMLDSTEFKLASKGEGRGQGLVRKDSRLMPKRKARRKALEAIKANGEESEDAEGDEDEEVLMDVEDEGRGDEDEDMEGGGQRSRSTSRRHAQANGTPAGSPPTTSQPRQTRRSSRLSLSEATAAEILVSGSDLTPPPASSSMDIDEEAGPGDDDDADLDIAEDAELAAQLQAEEEAADPRTTRSGKAFGTYQTRKSRLRQEAMDDPDMDVDGDEDEDEEEDEFEADYDLSDATVTSLQRLLRDELVQLCEARGIEVGGTKPQLAKALIEWRDEQKAPNSSSSTATARPSGSGSSNTRKSRSKKQKSMDKLEHVHAVASHRHVSGTTTPVLLRDHVHGHDPATPHASHVSQESRGKSAADTVKPGKAASSDASKRTNNNEAELNFDLAELGLEDSMIKPESLVKLERIGSGGFKDVYVGKLRGRKVAISEFRDHLSEMDIRELKLLAEFSHPNIVKFRGISVPEDSSSVPCMLVSELCENGDLFDYIRNVDPPSLKRLLQLMLDISRGLEYLHTRKPAIIHRDCKSSNILINRAGQAKVGDFGLARVKHSTRSMIRSLVGTVNWQAPELWHPTPRYDYKVDVFSAGMVFWEMMSGWATGDKKYPWEGHNEHYIYDAVGQKLKRPSVAGLRKAWGAEPVNLMERMWHQDAAERPTMSDVVADLEAMLADIS